MARFRIPRAIAVLGGTAIWGVAHQHQHRVAVETVDPTGVQLHIEVQTAMHIALDALEGLGVRNEGKPLTTLVADTKVSLGAISKPRTLRSAIVKTAQSTDGRTYVAHWIGSGSGCNDETLTGSKAHSCSERTIRLDAPGSAGVSGDEYCANMTDRPVLDRDLDEHEFGRWYFTMAELQPFARTLGVRAVGPKADLTERIGAALGGREQTASRSRVSKGMQLGESLTMSTLIPPGQRSSQALRLFFEAEIGQMFSFNGHMRSFLLAGGATLGDAVAYWYQTLGTELPEQSKSLEFNRFTQAWHAANPAGTNTQCREAWAAHRSLPVDERLGN